MKLYEITGMFAELFERFDELANYTPDTDEYGRYITEDGDVIDDLDAYREGVLTAWFDTLTAIEGEFNEKAVNIAVYIKNLNADISAMKQEEAQLKERRRRCERQAEQTSRSSRHTMPPPSTRSGVCSISPAPARTRAFSRRRSTICSRPFPRARTSCKEEL